MGSRNSDRIPRLGSLTRTGPGWLWLAVCRECGHRGALPVAQLIRRWGELLPIESAMQHLKCSECGRGSVEARNVRLCEPGCPRQRG